MLYRTTTRRRGLSSDEALALFTSCEHRLISPDNARFTRGERGLCRLRRLTQATEADAVGCKRSFYEGAALCPVAPRVPATLVGAPANGGTRREGETFNAAPGTSASSPRTDTNRGQSNPASPHSQARGPQRPVLRRPQRPRITHGFRSARRHRPASRAPSATETASPHSPPTRAIAVWVDGCRGEVLLRSRPTAEVARSPGAPTRDAPLKALLSIGSDSAGNHLIVNSECDNGVSLDVGLGEPVEAIQDPKTPLKHQKVQRVVKRCLLHA